MFNKNKLIFIVYKEYIKNIKYILNILRMHRTISKKIKLSKKSRKKKLKHKDGVIMYYHKGGGSKKTKLKRLQTIIFESMFNDITHILCGTTSQDIIHNIFHLSKDTLLGSFARGGPPPNPNESNNFFKGFQNYFLNNDNTIYEFFVNGIIKEAMKKYNLELLGFNYIGNENDFELKKIEDVDYDDWQKISKRINILITNHVRNTEEAAEAADNKGEYSICVIDHLKEIRTGTNWFDLTAADINFDPTNIHQLLWDKFSETFKELGLERIALVELQKKGFSYIFTNVLPIISKWAMENYGIPEALTTNIFTVFTKLHSKNILADESFIRLVKDMAEAIKNIVFKPGQTGGGKFTLMNIADKINSCITFAKYTKQAVEVCIEGYTLSKSISSTASNGWAMDAHQLNSLLSITNNYNSYDYKADIINKLMVVYKKKNYEPYKFKLAENDGDTQIKDDSGKPINLIQLMLDIRKQSTNVIEQGGFEEVYYPKKDLVLYLDKQPVLDPREELT